MKPFQCTYCAYSSNYKHDLKRHLKRHGIDSDNVSQFQQPFQQQIPEMQKINTQSPYLNQAINFSNSISVPPQQIINIQPPQHPSLKKPIFYDDQDEFLPSEARQSAVVTGSNLEKDESSEEEDEFAASLMAVAAKGGC